MTEKHNRNPVLLVHGLNDTGAVFCKMAPYLTNLGWYVYDLDLIPCNGDAKLDHLAGQVSYYINNKFHPEQPIDIVGFSMGGIVSRYYVQRLGGINRIGRLVTVASPHYGTRTAYLCDRKACLQLRPDSTFLQNLNSDISMLAQIGFTSIWTPFDFIIFPPESSKVTVGQNVTVPVLHHAWTVRDEGIFQVVSAALKQPLKPALNGLNIASQLKESMGCCI